MSADSLSFRKLWLALPMGVVVATLTYFWLQQPVSNQELVANFAKAGDFFRAAKSVRGIPWWSPMFMQGTSLAMDWSFMFTNAVMLAKSPHNCGKSIPRIAL